MSTEGSITLDQLKSVFEKFDTREQFLSGEPYGSGHINQTYWIKTSPPHSKTYILQKINHQIFKNVPKLMENICRVTQHLHQKVTQQGGNPEQEALTVVRTRENQDPFYQDIQGNYWRMYIFIENTRSYDIVKTPKQAFEGGRAFGQFQRLLDDLPGGPLFETIPNFHNIAFRYELFEKACQEDPRDRVKNILEEIEFVEKIYPSMQLVLQLGLQQKIPLRVTHNDTKFNNVLLDQNDKGLCVIDLDTVMPGYIHYDFSDAIRTGTNTAAEDEKDLTKIDMNFELFEAYTRAFLGEVGVKLNQAEWDSLGLSAKLLPFMIGLRFLTDYILGDTYFKTHFEGHNLQRARAQFELTRKIMAKEPLILKVISMEMRNYQGLISG